MNCLILPIVPLLSYATIYREVLAPEIVAFDELVPSVSVYPWTVNLPFVSVRVFLTVVFLPSTTPAELFIVILLKLGSFAPSICCVLEPLNVNVLERALKEPLLVKWFPIWRLKLLEETSNVPAEMVRLFEMVWFAPNVTVFPVALMVKL